MTKEQEARDDLQILIARNLAVVLNRMPGGHQDLSNSLEDEAQALEVLIHGSGIYGLEDENDEEAAGKDNL